MPPTLHTAFRDGCSRTSGCEPSHHLKQHVEILNSLEEHHARMKKRRSQPLFWLLSACQRCEAENQIGPPQSFLRAMLRFRALSFPALIDSPITRSAHTVRLLRRAKLLQVLHSFPRLDLGIPAVPVPHPFALGCAELQSSAGSHKVIVAVDLAKGLRQ